MQNQKRVLGAKVKGHWMHLIALHKFVAEYILMEEHSTNYTGFSLSFLVRPVHALG